ncbi:substrate-binding domain-containing protein, partial [bacterium]|nr:substrate-binding domain-containing protein [bacterium]
MYKKFLSLFLLIVLFVGPVYSATVVRGRITIKGSDTMVILVQRLAEEYMIKYRGKIVQVTGGGTGVGVAGIINRVTDIANASRPLSDKERDSIR